MMKHTFAFALSLLVATGFSQLAYANATDWDQLSPVTQKRIAHLEKRWPQFSVEKRQRILKALDSSGVLMQKPPIQSADQDATRVDTHTMAGDGAGAASGGAEQARQLMQRHNAQLKKKEIAPAMDMRSSLNKRLEYEKKKQARERARQEAKPAMSQAPVTPSQDDKNKTEPFWQY
jgi:hypothetical protein